MKSFLAFQPSIWVFGITLCGYGAISFLVTESQYSQIITIPYRVIVLIANVFLLLFNLGIISPLKKNNSIYSFGDQLSQKFIFILLAIFLFSYSCRLLYDIFVRNDIIFQQDSSQFIIFWFLITLIPGINFLFLDNSKSEKYLSMTWLFHCVIGIFAITQNPAQGGAFFADQNRLANAALNPISMGLYGSSLYSISLYMWLKKKHFAKSLVNEKWISIYLVSAVIGLTVAFLAGSRGPIIGIFLLSFLILFSSGKISLTTIFVVPFLIMTINIVFTYVIGRESSFFERILIEDEFDPDGNRRGRLLSLTINTIYNNLFTGFGVTLPDGGYPHNMLLESFLPFGLLGGVTFTWIWIYTLLKSLKLVLDYRSEWGWLGLLFIQYAIAGMSSGSLYAASSFWYLLIAVLSVQYNSLGRFKDLNGENTRTINYRN